VIGRVNGDVTNEGCVDVFDILAIQRHILGTVVLSGVDLETADANNNGEIDIYDILFLQRVIKGTQANYPNKIVTLVIKYTYDAVCNQTSIIYPGNKTVTDIYDDVNRIKMVTDWSGRQTTYDYDANSNLIKTTQPDGSVFTKN